MRAVRCPRVVAPPLRSSQRMRSFSTNQQNNDIPIEQRSGFLRPMIEPLRNTVEPYKRHVFICTDVKAEKWGPKPALEDAFFLSLLNKLKEAGATGPSTVRVTLSEETEGSISSPPTRDLLVFPDSIKLKGVQEKHLPDLAAAFVGNRRASWPCEALPLTGKWFFVCSHVQTDERCGYCGPRLVDQLHRLASSRLKETNERGDVHIRKCSHVGGHKYAGNVLVMPSGEWYGYVTPENLPLVFDAALRGEIHTPLLRGTMYINNPNNNIGMMK